MNFFDSLFQYAGLSDMIWSIFWWLYILTAVTTGIVIIAENRNPVKTISWILILVFLPIVGLIIYGVFGQDLSKRKIISRKSYRKIKKTPMTEFKILEDLKGFSSIQYGNMLRLFYNNNMAPPLGGNQVEIYTTGEAKFKALISALEEAKEHIHMEYYIYENDEIGSALKEILMEKARQGVEVRLLYDDVGTWKIPDRFFSSMQAAGVKTFPFLKVRVPVFANKMNYRDHRKIVVIDGKVGFIGGMNVADRYLKGTRIGLWRDTHIKIIGRGVYGLQSAFMLNWYFSARKLITDVKYFPPLTEYGDKIVQIVTSGPDSDWGEIMQGIFMAITSARQYIYLQTPYFMPNESILTAIETAALSGVDVRLMLSDKSDSRLVQAASESYVKRLLTAKVKVYMYHGGFLHSKAVVSDNYFSTVGSSNLDIRSFEHNFEANAFIYNEETAKELKKRFLIDQQHSYRVTLGSWSRRPLGKRIVSSVMRLFAPIL